MLFGFVLACLAAGLTVVLFVYNPLELADLQSERLSEVGLMTLRIVSLFNKDLRGLLQVAPDYMKPVNYDTRKLLRLLGPHRMTSYADGIGQTLTWILSSR